MTDTTLQAVEDTTDQPIKTVLDTLLLAVEVNDISVADPPLEQVIAEIYTMPAQ